MNSTRSRCSAVTLGTAAGGLLAVGLGIGAALAAPCVASADPSTDPYSLIGQLLGGLSVPAQASTLDMQVSIDGTDLFSTAGNTATATSDMGDIAIAIGNGADASAVEGSGDFAFADGANSVADAGFIGNFDSAVVFGANSTAEAGFGFVDPYGGPGATPLDIDYSSDLAAVFGDTSTAIAISGSDLVNIVP
jgi:hypothetical protein